MPVSAREESACAPLLLGGRTIALKASTKLPVQKTFSLAASERFVVAWLH